MYNKDAQKRWREKNREKYNKYMRKWNKNNREKTRIINRNYWKKNKDLIYNEYGNKCAKCGLKDTRCLSIDHVNNDGVSDRKQYGSGINFYRHIINTNFPDKYQLLCMNCQFIKHHPTR